MTNLAAAVGLPQLDGLAEMTATRQKNAAALRAGLAGVPGLLVPPEPPEGFEHVYHQFTIRITGEASTDRDTALQRIVDNGVGAGVYYPRNVFDYDCYRGHPQVIVDDVPHSTEIAAQVVSLPVHQYLSSDDVEQIIDVVAKAVAP